jgi:hypothetical protein
MLVERNGFDLESIESSILWQMQTLDTIFQ